jgi:hypothetical protein
MKLIHLLLTSLLLTGCSTRLVDFTIISSKNIELSHGEYLKPGPHRVKGEDRKHIIFFIPTGDPSVKEAMDRAIEGTPNAVGLVDGVVTKEGWYIPYIYGQIWYEVEGTPLIDTFSTH